MRASVAFTVLVATALTGCGHIQTTQAPPAPAGIRRMHTAATPAPFVEIQAGHIQALVPETWDAVPLPETRLPLQGFVAAPQIPHWERQAGTVNGMEAFWVDRGLAGIPSNWYYLVARAPTLSFLTAKGCTPAKQQVLIDHPPDLTGSRFSPSDYVAYGKGVCRSDGGAVRWAYVVAAPGFGPLRNLGIPTSGLYVAMAAVSGSRSQALLDEMINGARFDNTSISQFEQAAIHTR